MIKTITAYLMADKDTHVCLSGAELSNAIPEPTVRDPDATQWSSVGFSHPDYFGESPVFEGADGTRAFMVELRERVLPGKVIQTKLAERMADIEERQGYKCGRKQRAELRDEVIAALLPTAFIKPVNILCMVAGNYLMIGTGSARLVDLVIEALRNVAPVSFKHLAKDRSVGKWMTDLLLNNSTDSGMFKSGTAAVLRNAEKATARFKDMDLNKSEIEQLVTEGMRPIEIAVDFNERVSFALSDQLVIKRIRFSDILMEEAGEERSNDDSVGLFDANLALLSGQMRQLFDNLLSEMPEEDEL